MSPRAGADIYASGGEALALAGAAFAGRGFFTPVRRRLADGSWLGPETAVDVEARGLVRVPYTFGEPEADRRDRLVALAATLEVLPTPVGEAQGLDTLAFFAACRMACPRAHLVVDLELFGHKLGQLCLSFGADELMGSIVDQRELRLGARAGSNELTRDEAAQLLRASGFAPCERLPDGGVRPL
jgi:hypothetical protein